MKIIPEFKTRLDLFKASFTNIKVEGLYLEFGVYNGKSINNFIAALNPDKQIYGFDSFEGLPEDYTDSIKKNVFSTKIPEVRDNVSLIPGWFNDTLKSFLKDYKEKVAFLHMDADLYSSTKYVLTTLINEKRIQKGTVIQFDEIFFYEKEGKCYGDEFIALQELINTYSIKYKIIGFFLGNTKKYLNIRFSILIEEIKE